ncbi:hypothetical protein ACE38W_18000 [Chitinophaga sp. Hz27]|uniref:DUF6934 family protein n=1 Tax=Chitinophaga sp. Hz27 TaxID=3347169 RepID=UPI0035DA4F28
MNHSSYESIIIGDNNSAYEFFSIGPKGVILKRIYFSPTESTELVNLSFGDININGDIDDYSISNNGDMYKIIATICQTIEVFLQKFPNRKIYFKGSTKERTRLYRIVISKYIKEFELHFNIWVEQEDQFIPFHPNIEAQGFVITSKKY